MSARAHRRPLLGGPLVERRPDSCPDMADTPRGAAPAVWTLLDVVGVGGLAAAWLGLLWWAIELLARSSVRTPVASLYTVRPCLALSRPRLPSLRDR